MDEFHRGPYETAVRAAEMLIEIRIPIRARSGSAYEKVERRAGDWAVAAAGAAVWLAEDGTIADATIGLTAVGLEGAGRRRRRPSLRGQRPERGPVRRGRPASPREASAPDRRPARPASTTSATSPTSSPAAPSRRALDRAAHSTPQGG